MERHHLLSLLSEERRVLQQYGIGAMLEDSVVRVTMRILGPAYKTKAVPRLQDLASSTHCVYTSPRDAARDWVFGGDDAALRDVAEEYDLLRQELGRRSTQRRLPYPSIFGMQEDASFVVYALVRRHRPQCVLESGVANGMSTFYILHALLRNGHGELHSVDVGSDVGGLLDDAERRWWHYRRLDPKHLRRDFTSVTKNLPPIDIYLHDSDHTYRWQRFEHDTVLGAMASHGIFASDDADASYAFLDVCGERGLEPVYLVGQRKVLGIVRLRGSEHSHECDSVRMP